MRFKKAKEALFVVGGIIFISSMVLVVASAGAFSEGNIEARQFFYQTFIGFVFMLAAGMTLYATEDAIEQ